MHSLNAIVKMNREAAEKAAHPETNFDRHCSFSGTAQDGVVLHSAKLRNTVFLSPGARASKFLTGWWSRNSQEQRDTLVESYFI